MTYREYRETKYFPQLDGIRAVSVFMVVSVHVQDQAFGSMAGFLGVTLFFVISGYLITTLALREEEERGRLNLRAFYIRRAFRIFPLYYLALAAYAVPYLFLLPADKRALFVAHLPAYLLYYQEVPAFSGTDAALLFHHTWSLGIEEKFYLVWPFLAFVLLHRIRAARLPLAVLLIGTFGMMPLLGEAGYPVLAGCLAPYHFILIGCALALMLHDPATFERMRFLGKLPFVTALFLALVSVQYAMVESMRLRFGASWQSVYALLGALFMTSMIMRDGLLRRAASFPPLVWLGTLSYGIYLFHMMALSVVQRATEGTVTPGMQPYATLIGASVLSVGIAWGLAVIFERPMIRLGRRYAGRVSTGRAEPAPADAALGLPTATRS